MHRIGSVPHTRDYRLPRSQCEHMSERNADWIVCTLAHSRRCWFDCLSSPTTGCRCVLLLGCCAVTEPSLMSAAAGNAAPPPLRVWACSSDDVLMHLAGFAEIVALEGVNPAVRWVSPVQGQRIYQFSDVGDWEFNAQRAARTACSRKPVLSVSYCSRKTWQHEMAAL